MSELDLFGEHISINRPPLKNFHEHFLHAHSLRRCFPLVFLAYKVAVTAPVTVAEGERAFSKLRRVKTHLRSACGDERLESLMLMCSEKKRIDNLKPANIVNKWMSQKKRLISNL